MPRVTQAHLDARTRDIADAAYRVFARRGFASATMNEIAAEAGVSAGTLYNYFDSKEDIITTVASDVRARRKHEIDTGIGDQHDIRESLEGLTEAAFARLRDRNERYNFEMLVSLWSEAPRNPPIAASLQGTIAYVEERLAALWRDAQERGLIAPDVEPRSLATIMIAMREGLIAQLVSGVSVDVDAYMRAGRALLTGTLWTDATKPSKPQKGAKDGHVRRAPTTA